jgi:hypothetical protein
VPTSVASPSHPVASRPKLGCKHKGGYTGVSQGLISAHNTQQSVRYTWSSWAAAACKNMQNSCKNCMSSQRFIVCINMCTLTPHS